MDENVIRNDILTWVDKIDILACGDIVTAGYTANLYKYR